MPQTVADAVKRYRDAHAAVRTVYCDADDRVALAQRLCDRLAQAGYTIYNGNAETGETVDDGSGPDFWFTWSQGRDVETGETHHNFLAAAGDAMNHWFTNAAIDIDGRL